MTTDNIEKKVKFIKELRDKDCTWAEIVRKFNKRFSCNKSYDSIRNLYRRSDYYTAKDIPETKGSKLQKLKEENLKKKRKKGKIKEQNNVILCISDMHQPYAHPDNTEFLRAIKKKYKPDTVVCLGDEIDQHAMSFHPSDSDLPSAGYELKLAIEKMQPIYELFPTMHVVSSNHGDMVYRKGKFHGIPRKYLRDYGEVLDAPEGWTWTKDLVLPMNNGHSVYFHHGLNKDGLKVALGMGMCVVQGHYHTEFNIKYASSPEKLFWSMQVGCSIDDDALAFEYNKTTMGRPIIGHGIIINGQPKLLPMVLNPGGRWNGVVY